ncbi:unnamed protein product [Adineta steineri]|uniref:Uncharacterized protein n=1 Tax=Adineta steineri TaxID=433720 RepID=A0A815B0A3_9BILA|nr:unnamed protein product [Adineta steineri]
MGHDSSKMVETSPHTHTDMNGADESSNYSNPVKKRAAHGAFMAANPAGALIARAIKSSHARHNNNTSDSADDAGS